MTVFEDRQEKTPEQFARDFILKHKDGALKNFEQIYMYLEAREKVSMKYWDRVLLYLQDNPYKPPILED